MNKINHQEAITLRQRGYTYRYIAEKYSCSRQAVQQLFSRKRHPRMTQAEMVAANIQLPEKCVVCKAPALKKYCISCNLHIGEGRDRTRELVRIRDKHSCQSCNKKWFSGRRLDVHHLGGLCGKKSHLYDREKDMDMLITLCHKCHFNHPQHSFNL